ncbi:MAG: hypothetical protein ABIP42_14505, partial [Planctomycetota bacterium]
MDKRLSLALLLSVIVLVGWYSLFPPKPAVRAPVAPQTSAPITPSVAAAGDSAPRDVTQAPSTPALGTLVGDSEVRTLELHIGIPGKPGSYYARFTNLGARLL